jgi:hypothetical protein
VVEELPGVGGEGFDVLALAFGEQGVEGERGLTGAAQPGEYDEAVARNRERDVLQIVLTRPADPDDILTHEVGAA